MGNKEINEAVAKALGWELCERQWPEPLITGPGSEICTGWQWKDAAGNWYDFPDQYNKPPVPNFAESMDECLRWGLFVHLAKNAGKEGASDIEGLAYLWMYENDPLDLCRSFLKLKGVEMECKYCGILGTKG